MVKMYKGMMKSFDNSDNGGFQLILMVKIQWFSIPNVFIDALGFISNHQ